MDAWEYLNLLCLLLLVLGQGVRALAEGIRDSPFPEVTVLFHRKVTCNNTAKSENVYPSETWSCKDMRIDGHRMRYWYHVPDHDCTDAPESFGFYKEGRKNDVAGLCLAMLKANNIHKPLRAAFIHEPSCGHSGAERMLLIQNNSVPEGYEWQAFPAGKGYMRTLRCMLAD